MFIMRRNGFRWPGEGGALIGLPVLSDSAIHAAYRGAIRMSEPWSCHPIIGLPGLGPGAIPKYSEPCQDPGGAPHP